MTMTPEMFERNREVLRKFKPNDVVVIDFQTEGRDKEFGKVVGYQSSGLERKIYVKIEAFSYPKLRETDFAPIWTIDPVAGNIKVEHV